MIFGKSRQETLKILCGSKISLKSLYLAPFLRCVFAFYTEIQDGCQKWREKDFWEKSPDSADTLWVKNFVAIVLSCTAIKINVFLHFTQKCKMAAKNSG